MTDALRDRAALAAAALLAFAEGRLPREHHAAVVYLCWRIQRDLPLMDDDATGAVSQLKRALRR